MIRSFTVVAVTLIATAGLSTPLEARQVDVILEADIPSFQANGHRNLVRGSAGALYAAFIDEEANGDRSLRITASTNGGKDWTVLPFVVNDSTSGLDGPWLVNGTSMAIDSAGALHVVWGRYHYPTFFSQHYRKVVPTTQSMSAVVDITAAIGASTSSRTDALAIRVDAEDYVWLVTQGAGSWVDRLVKSTQPTNAALAFSMIGSISSNGNSAQQVKLAIGTQGDVHCVFYNNVNPGLIVHRAYDSVGGTWMSANLTLGDTVGGQDRHPMLAADALGDVHALYAREGTSSPTYEYRKRDGQTGQWGAGVTVASFSSAQLNGSTTHMHAMVCDEATGTVWVTLRDHSAQGEYVMLEKTAAQGAFGSPLELLPPSAVKSQYANAGAVGAMYPSTARTGAEPAFTLRRGAASPFEFVFVDPLGSPVALTYSEGCPGSGGFVPKLTLVSSDIMASGPISFQVADALGGTTCHFFFGVGQSAMPMGGGCLLNIWPILPATFSVPLGGSGPGSGTLILSGVLPSDTSGVTFTSQIFCIDSAGAQGYCNSKGLQISVP